MKIPVECISSKGEPHRVSADRIDSDDPAVTLATDGNAFLRPVTLQFRARAHHPQIFGGEIVHCAAPETDSQDAAILHQP